MPIDDDIDPKDRDLFRDSVRGTVPLGEAKPTNLHADNLEPAYKADPADYAPLSDHISALVTGDTELSFRRSGISEQILRELKKGKIRIDGALDLHGATVDEARDMLQAFLLEAHHAKCHCVRIIHGRGSHGGEAVLKNHVNAWLHQLPQILAFCSAPRHDGGTGAVYVLLRK
ncbi:MAG: Smr/MutS family protein [Pseudomonadota bacterium]|nr:Smr/MutS family protein [Pseudomonadota bacterium]